MGLPLEDLRCRELATDDAEALAELLGRQRAEYLRYFRPFPFDTSALANRLASRRSDHYWGLWLGEALAGFFMLRGWDDGYERPAFGVFVGEEFAGCGLARRAIEMSLEWCREHQVRAMMLTVDSQNSRAREIYLGAGLTYFGINEKTGQEMYQIDCLRKTSGQ